ncbi:MAG: hypothetical protein P4L33_07615 [Capsulimonadaceae bacterium]|nr:hypothetical protein [Capsulimonadaceae bacterium]
MRIQFGSPLELAVLVSLLVIWAPPATAQTSLVPPDSFGNGWTIWNADDAKSTAAPETPGTEQLTNMLVSTNISGGWHPGFEFPDQAKTAIDGTALRIDLGKVHGRSHFFLSLEEFPVRGNRG